LLKQTAASEKSPLDRRCAIKLLAVLGSLTALRHVLAQQASSRVPVIGFLRHTSLSDSVFLVESLRKGLKEAGYVEGQSVALEYRFADNQLDRLESLATDLVQRQVAVIVAGGNAAAVAAKKTTSTIPIVFAIGEDPVELGLVKTRNRPGGNVTGISFFGGTQIGPKRLQYLRDLVPGAKTIAYLFNPNGGPTAQLQLREAQKAAGGLGLQLMVLKASRDSEIDAAFQILLEKRVAALFVSGDAFYLSRRDRLVGLAAKHAIPTSYHFREFAIAGGLMSYGGNIGDSFRQAGTYVGRILKGENPGVLPVLEPASFDFVINFKAARALGLTIPNEILLRADEIIRE
jgi:putative ABC transport system substrate-binding protein